MDKTLVNLPCKRLQLDEAWGFSYCKQKNVAKAKAASEGAGDIWTWVALDADTKLVASFYVGAPDGAAALEFASDLAPRLASRVQITSDGHKAYLNAVEETFGADVDYAQLVKSTAPLQKARNVAIALPNARARSSIAWKSISIRNTSRRAL